MKRTKQTMTIVLALAISCLWTASLSATGQHGGHHSTIRRRARVNTRRERRMDRNKDGVVGTRERRRARQNYLKNRSDVNKKWEEKADKNQDGKIDRKELRRAEVKRYLDKNSDVDKKWEEKADKNGDGKIDANELKGWGRHTRARVNNRIEKKYDENGDGWLSKDEAKKMLEDGHKYRIQKNKDCKDTEDSETAE